MLVQFLHVVWAFTQTFAEADGDRYITDVVSVRTFGVAGIDRIDTFAFFTFFTDFTLIAGFATTNRSFVFAGPVFTLFSRATLGVIFTTGGAFIRCRCCFVGGRVGSSVVLATTCISGWPRPSFTLSIDALLPRITIVIRGTSQFLVGIVICATGYCPQHKKSQAEHRQTD